MMGGTTARPARVAPRARGARRGGLAGVLAAALAGTVAPVLGPSAPAAAAAHCVSEEPDHLGLQRCDDVMPPQTSGVVPSVRPNSAGWLRTGEVAFSFGGRYAAADQADADPIGFQCRLEGPSRAQGWTACTSPFRPAGVLADSGEAAYRFSVRAVDLGDHDQVLAEGADGDGTLYPAGPALGASYPAEAVPDFDPTPATLAFKVDTRAPVGLLFGRPSDPITPDRPVLLAHDLRLSLYANEAGAEFHCAVDGDALPCGSGDMLLRGLAVRSHAFRATVRDAAGNVGTGDMETVFWVAQDLPGTRAEQRSWRTVRRGTALGGSFLETRARGASLAVRGRRVRELRLLAPTGPGLGRVRVRIAGRRWTTFDLDRPIADDKAQFLVRSHRSAPLSGLVEVQVVSRGRPVRVDGLVLR